MSRQSKTARNKKIRIAVTARRKSERQTAAGKFPDLSVKEAYKAFKHERRQAANKDRELKKAA